MFPIYSENTIRNVEDKRGIAIRQHCIIYIIYAVGTVLIADH